MTTESRLRVSLATGEFEIEGPDTFIAQYDSAIQEILKRLTSSAAPAFEPSPPVDNTNGTPNGTSASAITDVEPKVPEFGEALHRLPKNASGTDQILVAGYYISLGDANRTFATADAHKLLIGQGVKLANASQSLKNGMDAKRVFKIGKKFKLSREGLERVGQLLGLGGPVP